METTEATPTTTKTVWNLDPTHSNLEFSVKHMMISTVKGQFLNFNASVLEANDDFSEAGIQVEIDTNSIHTGQEQREGHLKSPDFFDVANFPKAVFKSTAIEKTGNAGEYKIKGDLTIKDITKPVTLDVEFNGINKDPYGNDKAGFDFKTTINRSDYQLNWNVPLETGGLLVSTDVKIFGGVQLVKQKEA